MPIPASFRLAARRLSKSPGFTGLAVAVLAIGIGLNASVFSLVSSLLLRPLPVAEPDRLAHVYTWEDAGPTPHAPMAYPDFEDLRSMESFEDVLAHSFGAIAFDDGSSQELVFAGMTSGNYFSLLGVELALGRGFTEQEAQRGSGSRVAVLSHAAWRGRFGADPEALGRTVRVNGQELTIIGVAPAEFTGLARGIGPEIWLPMSLVPDLGIGSVTNSGDPTPGLDRLQDRAQRWHWVVGRLGDGVSLAQAEAELAKVGAALEAAYPDSNEDRSFVLLPARDVRLFPGADQAIFAGSFVLMGVVGLVLLIACANLANMLLVRAAGRRKEMATRVALGAGRWQLSAQLLAESLLLSGLGGAAGLGLAALSNRLLSAAELPVPIPIELGLQLDLRVIGFTLFATVATALLFGLLPALQATRVDLASGLRASSRGSSGGRATHRLRSALVVAQVTLSLVLTIAAVLAVRSLQSASEIDPGFETGGVVVAALAPGLQGYDDERSALLFEQLRERLEARPEIVAASDVSHLPLTLSMSVTQVAAVESAGSDPETWPIADHQSVSPGYFEALGIDLQAGRVFDRRDTADAPAVVVVNDVMAERFWPGDSAVGRRIHLSGLEAEAEVIGVVEGGKYRSLGEAPRTFFYFPLSQNSTNVRTVVVRGSGDVGTTMDALRQSVHGLDPHLVIANLQTLEETTSVALAMPRAGASLLGAFGGIGLLLAMLGLYGIIAYVVSQRIGEIGIRMALGADRLDVLGGVLAGGLRLVAVGIALGLAAAFATTHLLSSMLYGVSPTDPATLVAVPAAFLLVAALATLGPAWRASRVHPATALRHE